MMLVALVVMKMEEEEERSSVQNRENLSPESSMKLGLGFVTVVAPRRLGRGGEEGARLVLSLHDP